MVAGHFLGQKDSENAGRAAWQLVLFSSVLSIAVTIVLMGVHKPLLSVMFGQVETVVMDSAVTYLLITALSICPLAIYNACAALFRAMNDSKTTMKIAVVMNLLNLTGNAILIYGAEMGVAGAAWATTFSRVVAAALIMILMFRGERIISFKGQVTWKLDGVLIKRILYIGVPNGLENSLFQLGKILLLSLISTLGTYAIAANAVCNTLASLNALPGQAINLALLSVASMCVGAGDYKQARYYTAKLMKIAIASTAILSVAMVIFAPAIMQVYQLSPEAKTLAVQVIRWHAVMAVILWMPSFTLPNTLRAAGDVIWTMVIAIVSMWIFRIGFAYLLSSQTNLGLLGVWIAMTVDWLFRAICYCLRYKGDKWQHFRKAN